MKKTICVIFGGRSAEHEVSVESARTVTDKLFLAGYSVLPVYIPRCGAWRLVGREAFVKRGELRGEKVEPSLEKGSFLLRGRPLGIDAVFPLVHGSTGEDGVLQGFLELLGLPYVGSGVLASAAGMDKILSKNIAEEHGLPVLPHVVIRDKRRAAAALKAARRLGLPLFVKPVSQGSSVGVVKVKALGDLAKAVAFAFRFDSAVMIEKGVDRAREIVCGVLGSPDDASASVAGEVRPKGKHEFYDYEAKYLDENGIEFTAPARLSESAARKLRGASAAVFSALGCHGMARVDFFVDPKNEKKFYFGEINTIPGFTSHSLYPALWKNTGVDIVRLVDRLVRLALKRSRAKGRLKTARL
jgi:D-alanine-D-alanine ligase